jgi:hypothetical protein
MYLSNGFYTTSATKVTKMGRKKSKEEQLVEPAACLVGMAKQEGQGT